MSSLISVKTAAKALTSARHRYEGTLTSRVDKVPLPRALLSAEGHTGAFLLSGFDIAPDALELGLRYLKIRCEISPQGMHCTYQWTTRHGIVEAISYYSSLDGGSEHFEEFVVDAILNVDTRSCCAILACVVADT